MRTIISHVAGIWAGGRENTGKGVKSRKSLSLALAAALALVLALAGCGGNATPADQTTAAGDQQKPQMRLVKHAMGETQVPASPQRIVVLTNEGLEALLEMGIKPVGAVRAFYGDTWYDHLKAEMAGVKDVGLESQPNIEVIASLKPDLILGNKMRQEKVYEQLSKIAPTVFSETLRAEWQNNLLLYAEAVNKKEVGEKIVADFDKSVEQFRQKAGDKLKQTVSVVRFMEGRTRIYYNDTFPGVIFKKAGIIRPDVQNKDTFADEVTKERIPDMDADILFYFTYETGNGEATKAEKEWTSEPLWKNLNAVKNNKAYKVNDAVWTTAGGVKAAKLLLEDLYKYFEVSK